MDWRFYLHSVPTLSPPSWFPHLGESVLDSPAATPLIRRTLIIIPTGTTGVRTFTTILIPTHIRIITAPHTIGMVGTGLITVTIATTVSELAAWPLLLTPISTWLTAQLKSRCLGLKPRLGEAGEIWQKVAGSVDQHHRE